MRTCTTCGTSGKKLRDGSSETALGHSSGLDLSKRRHDGKLEFVEHVLGVLIESRYGDGSPYARLGYRNVTTGHSQMFANVRLLSEAEIEAHLKFSGPHHRPFFLRELPLASARGLWPQNTSGFGRMVVWAKVRKVLEELIRWLKPTAIPRTQTDHSSMPRGSPPFLGRSSFASFFAT